MSIAFIEPYPTLPPQPAAGRLAASEVRSSQAPRGFPSSVSPLLTPEDVERISRLLARCIGPVARVVIQRTDSDGATRQVFVSRVAGSLGCALARDRFLREAAAEFGRAVHGAR